MTNTPEPSSSRLDRIEAILERVANQQQTNTTAIAQLTTKVDQNTDAIAGLKQELQDSISHLVGVIGDFVEEGQSERQAFREQLERLASEAAQDRQQAAIDRQEFRTEIRRIWEYLRDRNGGSSPPQ